MEWSLEKGNKDGLFVTRLVDRREEMGGLELEVTLPRIICQWSLEGLTEPRKAATLRC